MIEIILDKRQSTKNEFFFDAGSTISKGSLLEVVNYINDNSNIHIEWIEDKDIVGNGNWSRGMRVLRKGQHD